MFITQRYPLTVHQNKPYILTIPYNNIDQSFAPKILLKTLDASKSFPITWSLRYKRFTENDVDALPFSVISLGNEVYIDMADQNWFIEPTAKYIYFALAVGTIGSGDSGDLFLEITTKTKE
jgi:hypothetical protein